jgi:hypothetical protein
VVPCYFGDVGANRHDYIYTAKAAFPKGSNRLISQLHAYIRRAKSDYTRPGYKARTLTLVADNYVENKNNALLFYCSELVSNRFFDVVEVVYGIVGHTHNGGDAVHKIHNRDVGKYWAGDLGHWIHNFDKAFTKNVPEASFVNVILDWDNYYRDCLQKIVGFSTGSSRSPPARGFRFQRRGPDGDVEVVFKADPAREEKWRGRDGVADTPGFCMCRQKPTGTPAVLRPFTAKGDKFVKRLAKRRGRAKKLLSREWTLLLKEQGLEGCQQFNYDAELTGTLPRPRWIDSEDAPTPPGELGRQAWIGGSERHQGKIRFIDEDSYRDTTVDAADANSAASLWPLPPGGADEHVTAVTSSFALFVAANKSVADTIAIPNLRYAGESIFNSAIADHPQVSNGLIKQRRPGHAQPRGIWESSRVPVHPGRADKPMRRNAVDSTEPNPRKRRKRIPSSDDADEEQDPDTAPGPGGAHACAEVQFEVVHNFVPAADEAKVGGYVAVLGEFRKISSSDDDSDGEPQMQQFLIIGKITKITPTRDNITYTELQCTKRQYTQECIGENATWLMPSSRQRKEDSVPPANVIRFFDSLTNSKKLKKKERDAFRAHQIAWGQRS